MYNNEKHKHKRKQKHYTRTMNPFALRRLISTQVPSLLLFASFAEAFSLHRHTSSTTSTSTSTAATMAPTTATEPSTAPPPPPVQTEEEFVDDFLAAASAAADQHQHQRAAHHTNTGASASASQTQAKKHPIDLFGIDHVVLRVNDLAGMTEWYETVLGCRVARRNEKFQMVHLDAGSSLIDLVDRAGPLGGGSSSDISKKGPETLDHLCLGLTDFDEEAIREHLSAHGVAIAMELGVRYGKGGYGESLYFEDPEGNRIEIKQSRLFGGNEDVNVNV